LSAIAAARARGYSRLTVTREAESEGSGRPRILRPLPDTFRGDLVGALALLAGVGLGALLFDSAAGLLGAAIGATVLVIWRSVSRWMRRNAANGRARAK
jgi:hypothetical protein